MLTAKQLVAYFQRAVAEGWGYVWSLNGELYSRELAQKYHDKKRNTSQWRDPATYWLVDCAGWIGKMAADCSGGIVGAFRSVDSSYADQGANTFYSRCSEKGAISTIPEIFGLCVWRDGHIGIYEGNGYALEFRGTEYGCVRTKLSERNFTNWGKLRDVDYANGTKEETKVAKIVAQSNTQSAEGLTLQQMLNAYGYTSLDGKPLVEDGKPGAKTMEAFDSFRKAHSMAQTVTVQVPAALPDALAVTVDVNGAKYTAQAKKEG